MASTSRKAPATKLILTPVMTLRGHEGAIPYLSYFPDGQRLISGSWDKTGRQWDLKAGKEIEEARDVCEKEVYAVAVSRNGRWIVSAGGRPELKACEIEKGIVRKFEGHSWLITCIDISADSTLLASGAKDFTARIWSLDTAKLVAGPFESLDLVGAVRFSTGSKKLAVQSHAGTCLEVWDVRSQKLDVRIGKSPVGFLGTITCAPVFWTNQNQNILAAFTFSSNDHAKTIYEFDATTLETVGVPFEGHTERVIGLALSFDGALLASAAEDDSIKLWAFRSRQVLACFDIQKPNTIVFSPDSRQLACTTSTKNNYKICIFNTPLDVLIRTGVYQCTQKVNL
ncbi:WD40 repeat-like protein [Suillus weaverae]|nr:WD40 repeat-like protein [Suillus weaverae]